MPPKNSIKRIVKINNYFKTNDIKLKRTKQGFGWKFDVIKNERVPKEGEYDILMFIKKKYERGKLCIDIIKYIEKEYPDFPKKWTVSNLITIISSNNFKWCVKKSWYGKEKDGHHIDNKNVYITNLKEMILGYKNKKAFKEDFKDYFLYINGKKLGEVALKRCFTKSVEKDKMREWLNEDKYYTIDQLIEKFKKEFPKSDKSKKSKPTFRRFIKEVKDEM